MCKDDLHKPTTQVDEQDLLREEAIMKIQSLITPKTDTMDELSRLFELNFCASKNPSQRQDWRLNKRLSRRAKDKMLRVKESKKKLFTVGAVEYGLPVPFVSRRNFYSSIIREQMHVLNKHIVNMYKTNSPNN
eukprot:TRINITY_DN2666_c0_g1_i1.p1 TRINITY_DN2666_c0_g1~~TRINITY_DN2666_c0_g1_i1.p1  ORF type:complete len:133 (+),score=21.98 TRINITY_DN2666_c0_g1_i1:557-955(+)